MKQITIKLSDILNRKLDNYHLISNNEVLKGLQANDISFEFNIVDIDLENNSVTLEFTDDRIIDDNKFNIDIIGNINYHKLINIIDSKVISLILNELINKDKLNDLNALHINNKQEIYQVPFKNQLNDYDLIFIEDYYGGKKEKVTLCDLATIINQHKFSNEIFIRIDIIGVGKVIRVIEGENIEITNSTVLKVSRGNTEVFQFEPNDEYTLYNVILDGKDLGIQDKIQLEDIQESHNIEVQFIKKDYIIKTTIINSIGGNVYPNTIEVKRGDSVKLYIEPNDGYEIDYIEIKEDNGPFNTYPNSNIIELTDINHNYEIRVKFKPKKYQVKIITDGNGFIEYQLNNGIRTPLDSTNIIEVESSDILILYFVPNDGSIVDSIIVNNINKGNISELKIESFLQNYDIVCIFKPIEYNIFITTTNNGKVKYKTNELNDYQIVSNIIKVKKHSDIEFKLEPDIGYHLENVIIDNTTEINNTYFRIDDINKNYEIKITFNPDKYQITTTTNGLGLIYPENPIVDFDSSIVLYANPNPGCKFKYFKLDNSDPIEVNPLTLTNIQENHILYAEFEELGITTYTIKTIAEEGVSISPYGELNVVEGESITFNFIEESNYKIKKIEIYLENQPPIILDRIFTYTLENIQSNGYIKVFSERTLYSETYCNIQVFIKGHGQVVIDEYVLNGPMDRPELISIQKFKNIDLIAIPYNNYDLSLISFDYDNIINPNHIQKIDNQYHYTFICDKDYFISILFLDDNYKTLSFIFQDENHNLINNINPIINVFGNVQQIDSRTFKVRNNDNILFEIIISSNTNVKYNIIDILANNITIEPDNSNSYSLTINENTLISVILEKKILSPGQTGVFGFSGILPHSRNERLNDKNFLLFPYGCNNFYYITINTPSNANNFNDLIENKILSSGLSNSTNNRAIITHGISNFELIHLKSANIINLETKENSGTFNDITKKTYASITFSNGTNNTGIIIGGISELTSINSSYIISNVEYNYNNFACNFFTKINISNISESLSDYSDTYDILSQGCSNLTNDRGIYISDTKSQILYYTISTNITSKTFSSFVSKQGNCKIGTASNGTNNLMLLVSTDYYNNNDIIIINDIPIYIKPCCTKYINTYINISTPSIARTFCDLNAYRICSRGVSNAEDNRAVFTGGTINTYIEIFEINTDNNTPQEILDCKDKNTIINGLSIIETNPNISKLNIDNIISEEEYSSFHINIDSSTLSKVFSKCSELITNIMYLIPNTVYHSMEYYQINNPGNKAKKFGDYYIPDPTNNIFSIIPEIKLNEYNILENKIQQLFTFKTKQYIIETKSLSQLYPAATSNG